MKLKCGFVGRLFGVQTYFQDRLCMVERQTKRNDRGPVVALTSSCTEVSFYKHLKDVKSSDGPAFKLRYR